MSIGIVPAASACATIAAFRSEEHTSELQSQSNLVCRLLLEKKKRARHYKPKQLVRKHLRAFDPEPNRLCLAPTADLFQRVPAEISSALPPGASPGKTARVDL